MIIYWNNGEYYKGFFENGKIENGSLTYASKIEYNG